MKTEINTTITLTSIEFMDMLKHHLHNPIDGCLLRVYEDDNGNVCIKIGIKI